MRWAVLAAVAERNLTVARGLEAHSDALTILAPSSDMPVPPPSDLGTKPADRDQGSPHVPGHGYGYGYGYG